MKTAVITGTNSGIGREISKYYREKGWRVVGVNRKPISPTSPVDALISCDLSTVEGLAYAISQIKDKCKVVDVLVNNAGQMIINDLLSDVPPEQTIKINLVAPIYLCKSILPLMPRGGHIINIASVVGITGDADCPIYAATKSAIINLSRSLAKKLAPSIRVNSISPGFFKTNLVPGDTPKFLINKVPMKREADATEIREVIHFIHESKYLTGANIVIDGGLSL